MFVIIYLVLARVCKLFSKTVQIHSIIHCVTAFILTSVLFINEKINPFSFDAIDYLTSQNNLIIEHSLGYFIADTIDIFLDHENIKRRVYILHHLVAIAGLLNATPDAIYPIWALEMGGVVHHLKYAAEVHNFRPSLKFIVEILYHVVYLTTRILVFINLYYSNTKIINTLVMYVLLIQNLIWWSYNLRKLLT